VAAEFDLNLLPIYRIKGQEWPQLPGLLTMAPPKRAARGREDDHLLIYLTLSGNTPISSIEYNQIMTRVAQRFYKAPGSLTFAIRTTVEMLNQFLLNRNLNTTGKGQYVIGRLILGALRGAQFVFAQCGPTHVFHLTSQEARQIHDVQIAGRGLGIGQTTPLYFAQTDLHAGDLLVLCSDLPARWEAALLGERKASPETLRRKLLTITDDDLNAVLLQSQAGKGNLNILKGTHPAAEKPASTVSATVPVPSAGGSRRANRPVAVPATPETSSPDLDRTQISSSTRPTSQVESGRPASRFFHILSGAKSAPPADVPGSGSVAPQKGAETSAAPAEQRDQTVMTRPVRRPAIDSTETVTRPIDSSSHFVSPRTTTDIPEIKRPVSRHRRELFRGLAKVIQGARRGTQKISQGLKNFLPNLLPNPDGNSGVASSSMATLAIVIPVIIVAIAGTVYLHYGRTTRYQQNYDRALAQAAQARGQTSPTEVRHAWDSTIYYLDLAEQNQVTQDSTNLRQEAQTALDNLDGILRLDFRSAIVGALSRTAQISHMAATDTDLYLLDTSRGNVIRAFMTGQGYEVDPSFKCDPGQYGTMVVDALVDLEALPMSNIYNARVLAMDAKGALLYCGLADPVAVSLVPPQLGWRGISAFSLDSDGKNIYVLDPAGNAVWQYAGNFGQFPDLPIMFFGEQVPQNMNSAIDLTANNADLYLLFQDGHVTSCPLTRYDVVPMRCADPATFMDTRPERQPGPKINDAIFAQMTFASAPDPSLYMLEPLTRAVYRFSPRSDSLELRGQFRASMEQSNTLFNGPATAMTISPNRYIFFSIGNQVFFATDVP